MSIDIRSVTAVAPSIVPNSSPQNGEAWFSDSIAHLFADPSPVKRFPVGVAGQEASVWEYNGVLKIIYQVNGLATFIVCSGDPTVAANWSAPVTVLGNGVGGLADFPLHGFLYIEGSTLYYYYVNNNTQNVGVATASLTTSVPSFTNQAGVVIGPQGSGLNGNPCVVKDGSTYRMFLECFHADAQPEGNVPVWLTIMATASSPLGPFTVAIDPVTSLRPDSRSSVSGLDIHREGNLWVALYHGGAWGAVWPNDIYRATTTDLSLDDWTVDNSGYPSMRRAHQFEIDQVADASFVRRANGMSYLVYTAADNRYSLFKVMITQLNPSWRRWDGFKWASIQSGADTTAPQGEKYELRQFLPVAGPNGSTPNTVGVWTVDGSQAPLVQYNSSNAQNDQVEYDVTLPPGNYQIDVFYQKGAGNAIINVGYDDGAGGYGFGGGNIDAYAASGSSFNKATRQLFIHGTETFRRRARFKAAARNASATGWKIAVHGWQIRDDGPYPTLLLNGDFSEGLAFWGTPGTLVSWSMANNAMTIVRNGGFDAHPAQNFPGLVVGQQYKATFDVSGAQVHAVVGGASGNFNAGTGQSLTFTAATNNTNIEFWPVNDPATSVVSNVQIRQVPS